MRQNICRRGAAPRRRPPTPLAFGGRPQEKGWTLADTETVTGSEATERPLLMGRRRILAAPTVVTADNVAEVIDRAMLVHSTNSAQEDYLHRYFLGDQPVLHRTKEVRSDINNPVVENRAYQFVKDRTDALVGEPITYSAHGIGLSGDDEGTSDKVQTLNDYCIACDKHASDLELVQWMMEVGVGYRLVLPTPEVARGDTSKPFVVASLDPRHTCVVYSNDAFHEPLYAINEVRDPLDGTRTRTLYTPDARFEVTDGEPVKASSNPLGMVPIIEYQANPERMGVFEAVVSLFDAINEVESNRVDGIAQFVQALMVLTNVDIDEDEYAKMLKLGAVKINSTGDLPASVEMLTAELNQEQTQTLVDSLYKTALSICGMPYNVGGSASTSDTGVAVTMRDGWSNSEARCKETEVMFRRSERRFLDAALYIADQANGLGLGSESIEIKFTRRNYEAIQSKTQVLTTLLGSGKVHPRLAFQYCGMFSDPEDAYDQSEMYVEQQRELQQEQFEQQRQLELAKSNRSQNGGSAGDDNGKPASGNGGQQGDATPVNKA